MIARFGWVDAGMVDRWRRGRIDCLESAIPTNPARLAEALEPLRSRAARKGLIACEVPSVARAPQRRALRCSRSGDLLMEDLGPLCLACVGLGDLEFLPAGDALLTRRAKAKSARHAVVVRIDRSRKRYERQGLLVEAELLRQAKESMGWKSPSIGTAHGTMYWPLLRHDGTR